MPEFYLLRPSIYPDKEFDIVGIKDNFCSIQFINWLEKHPREYVEQIDAKEAAMLLILDDGIGVGVYSAADATPEEIASRKHQAECNQIHLIRHMGSGMLTDAPAIEQIIADYEEDVPDP